MKLKDIDKKYEEANEKLVSVRNLRNEALKLSEEYSRKAEEAAGTGDVDKYMELDAMSNKQKALAYVYQKQIEQLGTVNVSKSEAIEAWNDYAKSYAKTMKALSDEFQKEKEKLLKKYAEMVDLQDEACKARERLGSYIGKNKQNLQMGGGYDNLFPMEYIQCLGTGNGVNSLLTSLSGATIKDPDAVYYLSSLKLNPLQLSQSQECKRIQSVVQWRVSSK